LQHNTDVFDTNEKKLYITMDRKKTLHNYGSKSLDTRAA
jgi:hypothetical protein